MDHYGFRHRHNFFLSAPKFRTFYSDLYESNGLKRDIDADDDADYRWLNDGKSRGDDYDYGDFRH